MTSTKENCCANHSATGTCSYCQEIASLDERALCADCSLKAHKGSIVFKKDEGWVCRRCESRGWYWSTPADFNPFYRGIHETSRAMRRTQCTCKDATDKPAESAMERALRAIAEAGRAA